MDELSKREQEAFADPSDRWKCWILRHALWPCVRGQKGISPTQTASVPGFPILSRSDRTLRPKCRQGEGEGHLLVTIGRLPESHSYLT